uniref:Uncharacterized protein n=1 Tax=Labrus bergylta TaxID=56723 RepID=A0A3Q3GWM6_9LABR
MSDDSISSNVEDFSPPESPVDPQIEDNHRGPDPYRFDPLVGAARAETADDEDSELQERMGTCSCSHCYKLSPRENVCCMEVAKVTVGVAACITAHPGFEPVALNPYMLQALYGTYVHENSRGPRMDPCGIPQLRPDWEDVALVKFTEKVLLFRYDVNQVRAVPPTPTQCCRQLIKIVWSTVSNAAVRSSKIRKAQFTESILSRRSLWILRSADSVLWAALKPD